MVYRTVVAPASNRPLTADSPPCPARSGRKAIGSGPKISGVRGRAIAARILGSFVTTIILGDAPVRGSAAIATNRTKLFTSALTTQVTDRLV